MKKSRNILILTAVVLLLSFVFCFTFAEISKMNNSSNEEHTLRPADETIPEQHSSSVEMLEETEIPTTYNSNFTTTSKPETTSKIETTSKPETTKHKSETIQTTAKTYEDILDSSNALWLLSNAVYCYDGFLNTTTFNLEYDYYGEYIICPHCGDQAFLVKNYSSFAEMNAYIDKYLTGEAKNLAEEYLQECIDFEMLTEYNGNLYVCGMYNDKGYSNLNCSSIRLISKYSDGSALIAVDDFDSEETYYLDVYFIDGKYKIG